MTRHYALRRSCRTRGERHVDRIGIALLGANDLKALLVYRRVAYIVIHKHALDSERYCDLLVLFITDQHSRRELFENCKHSRLGHFLINARVKAARVVDSEEDRQNLRVLVHNYGYRLARVSAIAKIASDRARLCVKLAKGEMLLAV